MRVALITEGTYPYVHGGVSVWCDRLIRELPDIDFALYAIAPIAGRDQLWTLPTNVVSIEATDLNRSERRFDRYGPKARQEFLEAFDRLLIAILEAPTPDERSFLEALHALFIAGKKIPIVAGVRSPEAFELTHLRWNERSVGDRLDQMGRPSLSDVLEVTSSLSRFLTALEMVPDGDVVHSTAAGLGALSAFAGRWEHGTPCLLTEHGIYLRERYLEAQNSDVAERVSAFQLLFFRRLNDASLQTFDLITPVSDYNRRWELELGADRGSIQTIHNGVDPSSFPEIVGEPSVPTVSWLGRVDPLKDVVNLIEAFAEAREVVPDAKLRLFGPVPEGNEGYYALCLTTIEDLALREDVTFEGPTSRPADAFRAGHVVALSSISEGFPFTVLEAMMSGRATVSTDVGGVAEAVGKAGLLVPPRDSSAMGAALARVLTDDELRRRLGSAARERVRSEFTLGKMADQYRDVYGGLAAASVGETLESAPSDAGGGL
jgi:glycosyltransferase involved in cell wall biosynthesis